MNYSDNSTSALKLESGFNSNSIHKYKNDLNSSTNIIKSSSGSSELDSLLEWNPSDTFIQDSRNDIRFVQKTLSILEALTINQNSFERISNGSSGSYFCKNTENVIIGVFKPKDEEPYGPLNPKWSKWFHKTCCPCVFGRSCLQPNQGYLSEAGASIVDRTLGLDIVPKTYIVKLGSNALYYSNTERLLVKTGLKSAHRPKIGSLQIYVENYKSATEQLAIISCLGDSLADIFQKEFEKLVILDYITRNTDRGNNNWMIKFGYIGSIIENNEGPRKLMPSVKQKLDGSYLSQSVSSLLYNDNDGSLYNFNEKIPSRIVGTNEKIPSIIGGNENNSTSELSEFNFSSEFQSTVANEDDFSNLERGFSNSNYNSNYNSNNISSSRIFSPGLIKPKVRKQQGLNNSNSVIIQKDTDDDANISIRSYGSELQFSNSNSSVNFFSKKDSSTSSQTLEAVLPDLTDFQKEIVGQICSVRIAAIDNGLSFPFKHPDNWRAYPYYWAYLPQANTPFSQYTIDRFLPILSDEDFVESLIDELRTLFMIDIDFHQKVFDMQASVIRGQIINLVACLKRHLKPADLVNMRPIRAIKSLIDGELMIVDEKYPTPFFAF